MTPAAAAQIAEIAHRFTLCETDGDRDRVAAAIKAVMTESWTAAQPDEIELNPS